MRQIQINEVLGSEIITVTDAKNFIRIDTTADDTLLGIMIEAAHTAAENYMSRDIIAKNRKYYLDYTSDGLIDIPWGPIDEIVSVQINNIEQTGYTVYGLGDKMIELEGNARDVIIEFTTLGMSDGILKQALLMMVSTYYDNRTDFVTGMTVNDVPSASAKLLDGLKSVFI